jgi:sugar fermentation stimulation protein A
MSVFLAFPEPRELATFLGRRRRFLADVRLADGTDAVAHCANTGSMKGCLFPGARVVLSRHADPRRKLPYTWRAIEGPSGWIGVDTTLPNRLAAEAIRAGLVPALRGFPTILAERRMGVDSRVDLLLDGPAGRCWVEVKNVTLVENGVARFPDAVTARGLKHLQELGNRVREGDRAAMLYVVQREDAGAFEPAADIDPEYARAFREARRNGVEAFVLGCGVHPSGVEVASLLPLANAVTGEA